MVFESMLNPILNPVLNLPPFFAIVLMSFVISLFITIIYKLVTDQDVMHSLKEQLKQHQQDMKKHRDDPEKVLMIQKQAMGKNLEYMKHSFKPTLITFIPIIIIFGWMSTHFGYFAMHPGQNVDVIASFDPTATGMVTLHVPDGMSVMSPETQNVNESVTWVVHGRGGEYQMTVSYKGVNATAPVLITNEQVYKNPVTKVEKDGFQKLTVGLEPIHPLNGISIFGWRPGWLATYIIFSIIFSMSMRKILRLS